MSSWLSSSLITVSDSFTSPSSSPSTGTDPYSRVTVNSTAPTSAPGPRPQPAAANAATQSSAIAAVVARPRLLVTAGTLGPDANRHPGRGNLAALGRREAGRAV